MKIECTVEEIKELLKLDDEKIAELVNLVKNEFVKQI